MQLIIGGRAQGKLEYTCQISGLTRESVSDYKLDPKKKIIHHLELYIKEQLKKDTADKDTLSMSDQQMSNHHVSDKKANEGYRSEQQITNQIVRDVMVWNEESPDGYLICDEVGCGIVPLDPFERRYREITGRVLCELVKQCSKVHRVFCGIGVVIKDA